MWCVRAGFQHHIEDRSARPAVFGGKGIGDGLEFRNRVRRWVHHNVLRDIGEVEVAVQVPGVRPALASMHGEVGSQDMRGIREASELAVKAEVGSRRSAHIVHAWNQKDELLQVAALNGQLVDGLGVDAGAVIRGVRFQQRRLGRYLNRLLRAAQFQLSVYPDHLAGGQRDLGDVRGREPGSHKVGSVLAGHEVHGPIVTRGIGLQRYCAVGFDIGDGHVDPRHYGSLGIG